MKKQRAGSAGGKAIVKKIGKKGMAALGRRGHLARMRNLKEKIMREVKREHA